MKESEQQAATPFFTELNKALGNQIPLPHAVFSTLPLATPLDFPVMSALLSTALMGYLIQPNMAMSMPPGMNFGTPMISPFIGGEGGQGIITQGMIAQGMMAQGMITQGMIVQGMMPSMLQGFNQGMAPQMMPQGMQQGLTPPVVPLGGMPGGMIPPMVPSIPPASPPASPATTSPSTTTNSGPTPPATLPFRPRSPHITQSHDTEDSPSSVGTVTRKKFHPARRDSSNPELLLSDISYRRRGRSSRLDPWFVQQTGNIRLLEKMKFRAIRIDEKLYKCSLCEYESLSAAGCSRHATVEHTKFRYKCEHCDYEFTRPDALRRHLERKSYCKSFYKDSIQRQTKKMSDDGKETQDEPTSTILESAKDQATD